MQNIIINKQKNKIIIVAKENWSFKNLSKIYKTLLKLPCNKKIIFDFKDLKEFDTSAVIVFIKIYNHYKKCTTVKVINYTKEQYELFLLLKDKIGKKIPQKRYSFLYELGKSTIEKLKELREFINFLGEFTINFFYFFTPKNFRYKEIIYHIYASGVSAISIIAITAFLVGMVISYQASVELSKFGADIFIVDTVAISITRELGPMITAIVIAGRSGSSYTAEIGAMKLTQEIDAMKTMGFNPFIFLVIPRVIALIISLPLLSFLADMIGIYGGFIAAKMETGINATIFLNRLYETLELKHYILGLIKTPIFAITIALIGSFRGFLVSNNTQSIGLETTASVVNSIFLVIAIDALFSVIYTELGL